MECHLNNIIFLRSTYYTHTHTQRIKNDKITIIPKA